MEKPLSAGKYRDISKNERIGVWKQTSKSTIIDAAGASGKRKR